MVDPSGPETFLGDLETVALLAKQVGDGHADVVVDDLAVAAVGAVVVAEHGRRALHGTPGVSLDTRIMLWRRYRSASGSVTPITISSLQRGDIAPEDHHLRPLIT